jgi:serine/threonine protein kinase
VGGATRWKVEAWSRRTSPSATSCGTPAYMSPEQKAGNEVTTRSDLYSPGLTLHEMLTGKGRSETQSSPSEIVKDLDPAVEPVILRCLEEHPKRRPSSG